jgi:hypothetical protein
MRPSIVCASATPARPNMTSRRCRCIIFASLGLSLGFSQIEVRVYAFWQYLAIRRSDECLAVPGRLELPTFGLGT